MQTNIRQPAVAGMFYPADPTELKHMVQGFLRQASHGQETPKAIVVPHAGYIYSGPIAATAYASLEDLARRIKRVVLLGPSHRVGFHGLAAPSSSEFSTPLGNIRIDQDTIQDLLHFPQVLVSDEAHAMEHSLEVHLPFLQETLQDFQLIPLVVGDASAEEVAEVLEQLWGDETTLIVISTDLSHYHSYDEARRLDAATSRSIEQLRYQDLGYESACGRNPLSGLLYIAGKHGLSIETLDVRNSGDTAGPRDRVVGYGAYLVH